MKKIIVVLGICMVLVAMPLTTAFPLLGSNHITKLSRHARPALANGTFTGVFAEKNESGYIPLGNLSGTYQGSSFTGIWTLDDGSASGALNGWSFGNFFIGQMNTTGTNQSNWFLGLYRVNTTDNSFVAGAIIGGSNGYFIRYAMGTI